MSSMWCSIPRYFRRSSPVSASGFFWKRFSSTMSVPADRIRNVAIVAHVDHGKTTLVNELLSQAGMKVGGDRMMDNIALEKERGITIMSKCTRVDYEGHVLNIVDTPGHSDFGGEVERVLSMVDGVILVVDSAEGVMPQTKFVLRKALAAKLAPVVVINKVDKDTRRINGPVENEIFDLFVNLDADDDQLEFPVLYASAKNGWAVEDMDRDEHLENKDLKPVFRAIIDSTPAPKGDADAPFQMLVTSIEHDDYLGRVITGKVSAGSCRVGDAIKGMSRDGTINVSEAKVTKLMVREGLTRVPIEQACVGDIVSLAGIRAGVTDTVCSPGNQDPIKALPLDPPTISMTFSVNDGPLAGLDGSKVTSTALRNRLESECENNVAISIKQVGEAESFDVQGRGELQMGILLEQMRREDYELCVSPPRVLMKKDENGDILEPVEEVTIDVESEFASSVIDKMQRRGADMIEFNNDIGDRARLIFHIASRRLMGYRSEFQTDTRGNGVFCSAFHSYKKRSAGGGDIRKGVLVSLSRGTSTSYALAPLEARGELCIGAGEECYEGMIIGENARDDDLDVNPVKAKKLSNMRASGKDETVRLAPPRPITIEGALTYIQPDEMVEITPHHIRLRKRILSSSSRKRDQRRSKRSDDLVL